MDTLNDIILIIIDILHCNASYFPITGGCSVALVNISLSSYQAGRLS